MEKQQENQTILSDEKPAFKKTIINVFIVMGTIFTILLGGIGTLLVLAEKWMLRTWKNVTMEELVFHLKAPLEGTDMGLIKSFIFSCAIWAVIMMIVLCIVFVALRKRKKHYFVVMLVVVLGTVSGSAYSIWDVWNKLEVSAYIENQSTYSNFIENTYVNPQEVQIIFPEQKRNLIYIFLESMETTYATKEEGGAFEETLFPELVDLAKENEDFSGESEKIYGAYAPVNTTWTMAAMFAQTSGLPLSIPIAPNEMDSQESFFPSIKALGDILEEAGYEQSLFIGSNSIFGGRNLYFTEHGDYYMQDYFWAKDNGEIPEDYHVWWGYEDKKLFDLAKENIAWFVDSGKPFNFTMLTTDTHAEDGYKCEDCPDTYGDNQYANAIACSSKKVGEFVRWIQEQPFYENTTIVLVGDHPTMDSDFCEDVNESYERKVYTTFINSPVEANGKERTYTTFDLFPTTLASLGVIIEGERLGLGTNLFSEESTLAEEYGYEVMDDELSKKSKLMEELTADIRTHEEIQEVGKAVTADISVTPYDYQKGKVDIEVSNVKSDIEMQSIRCAVWSKEDQSDIKWYDMRQLEDGKYQLSVYARDFLYQEGVYFIDVYAMCGEEAVLINSTTTEIR